MHIHVVEVIVICDTVKIVVRSIEHCLSRRPGLCRTGQHICNEQALIAIIPLYLKSDAFLPDDIKIGTSILQN